MRVLLTGGTGFIGRYALTRLVNRGDDVRVLALPETVQDVRQPKQVDIIAGSLSDPKLLLRAARNIDVIVHLAAKIPGPSERDYRRINVGGTQNLLDAAVETGVERFVYMSSTAVYGLSPFAVMWPIREDSPLAAHGTETLRLYGASKIEAENAVRSAHEATGLEYVILRPTVAYGRGAAAAERLLLMLLSAPPRVWLQLAPAGAIQWVHVSDLIEVLLRATAYRPAANQAFNVAGPEVVTMAELAAALRAAIASPFQTPLRFMGASGVRSLRFDVEKAAQLLAYRPTVGIHQGLLDMFGHLQPDKDLHRNAASEVPDF